MRFMVSFKERLSYNLGLIYILSYQILLLSCVKRKKGQGGQEESERISHRAHARRSSKTTMPQQEKFRWIYPRE